LGKGENDYAGAISRNGTPEKFSRHKGKFNYQSLKILDNNIGWDNSFMIFSDQ